MSAPFRPALVLAPGMLSDDAVWAPQAEAFGSDFDVRVARYGEARTLAAMAEALLAQALPVPVRPGGPFPGRTGSDGRRPGWRPSGSPASA